MTDTVATETNEIPTAEQDRTETPLESLASICTVLAIGLFVMTFIFQNFEIPSASMVKTLLIGDHVLVESPTFLTALDIFEGRGLRLIGVPVDADGMRVDAVGALIERYRPRLIYTIPTAQNPTGVAMSDDRRRRLAALAG